MELIGGSLLMMECSNPLCMHYKVFELKGLMLSWYQHEGVRQPRAPALATCTRSTNHDGKARSLTIGISRYGWYRTPRGNRLRGVHCFTGSDYFVNLTQTFQVHPERNARQLNLSAQSQQRTGGQSNLVRTKHYKLSKLTTYLDIFKMLTESLEVLSGKHKY